VAINRKTTSWILLVENFWVFKSFCEVLFNEVYSQVNWKEKKNF
jgi:hypothetical protein